MRVRNRSIVCVSVAVLWALTLGVAAVAHGSDEAEGSPAAELDRGIRQVRGGEFEAAVSTLDAVTQRLSGQDGQQKLLARTYVYLSIAHLELGQQSKAEELFASALVADPGVSLSEREFSPRHRVFFREALERVTPPGKHGSGKWLAVGAGATAASVGAVLVAGGGGDVPPAPAATPSPPATSTVEVPIDDDRDGYTAQQGDCNDSDPTIHPGGPVTAEVHSSMAFDTIGCGSVVTSWVVLTDRSCDPVSVSSITWQTDSIGSEGCGFTGTDSNSVTSTYSPTDSRVSAGVGETIWSSSRTVRACCPGHCTAARCTYLVNVSVQTSVGTLGAGSFQYDVDFTGCSPCSAAAAALPCQKPGAATP